MTDTLPETLQDDPATGSPGGPTPPPPRHRPGGRPAPLSRRGRVVVIGAVAVLAVLVVSFGLGSSTSDSKQSDSTGGRGIAATAPPTTATKRTPSSSSAASTADKAVASPEAGGTATADGGVATTPGAPTSDPAGSAPIDPKIIKTANLELEVRKGSVGQTFTSLTALASGSGGFVATQQTNEVGGSPSGTITLRIPSASFDDVVVGARKLGRVTSATTGGQDVTAEYTDTDARLKSLSAERDQLALVLSSATNVPDILSVRDRMTSVQTEIEQLQGRKNVLDNQTSLATLTVSVHEKGDVVSPVPTPEKSGFSKAWAEAVDGFNSTIQSIIAGSGRTLVLLIIGLVLFLVGRLGLKAARRRWPAPTA